MNIASKEGMPLSVRGLFCSDELLILTPWDGTVTRRRLRMGQYGETVYFFRTINQI